MVKHKFKIHSLIKTIKLRNGKKTATKNKEKKVATAWGRNKTVLEWFSHARSKWMRLSGPMLQEETFKFATDFVFNITFCSRQCPCVTEVNEDVIGRQKSAADYQWLFWTSNFLNGWNRTLLQNNYCQDNEGQQCKYGKVAKQRDWQ